MKVIIVGAGYVGGTLATRLAAKGHEIWAVRRTHAPQETPSQRVHHVIADAVSGVGLEALPSSVDAVVYAVSPDSSSDEAYRAAYPDGVQRVLTRHPNARFLLVSSTSVYGQNAGEWVDEESPTEPQNASGQRILEAEALTLRSSRNAVVRAAGIYGPGRTSLIDRVLRGEARTPQSPVYSNRIQRDDLARALAFLLGRPELGGCFVATDTEPAELGQLLAWLAARLDVPSPELESSADAPRSRHRLSRRCLPHRLIDAGFSWHYPTFREGYAALVDERKTLVSAGG